MTHIPTRVHGMLTRKKAFKSGKSTHSGAHIHTQASVSALESHASSTSCRRSTPSLPLCPHVTSAMTQETDGADGLPACLPARDAASAADVEPLLKETRLFGCFMAHVPAPPANSQPVNPNCLDSGFF